jgi:mannosyltransferase
MTTSTPRPPALVPATAGPTPAARRLKPEQVPDWLIITLPGVLAAFLCLLEISTRSLGFDEAATVTIAAQHGSALLRAIAHDGGNMSGFYVLLHLLIGWFGNDALVIRAPSAVASVATVALSAAIALHLFGRRAAAFTGLLTAVSLPLVFWAQNARGYALMVAFVCAAYLVFVTLPENPSPRRWVAFAVLMTLGLYSSFVAVLVVPAQLLALLAFGQRRRLRGFALSLLGIAVLCTPLILLAARRGSGQLFWVPRPTHEIEVQVLQSLTGAGLEPSFHTTASTTTLLVLTLAGLIAVAAAHLPAWRRARGWGAFVTVTWVVVPALLTFLYSLLFQPLFLPRNLLMSVPAVGLLLAAGLAHPRLSLPVALAGLTALLGLRAWQLAPSYGVSPEPWRQAATYVRHAARPGDCIAFYPADGRMAFEYFYGPSPRGDRGLPRPILPIVGWNTVRPYVEDYATLTGAQLAGRGRACRRLWFISSHEGQANGPLRSQENLARYHQLSAELGRAFGPGQARKFGYASAIHVDLLGHPHHLGG